MLLRFLSSCRAVTLGTATFAAMFAGAEDRLYINYSALVSQDQLPAKALCILDPHVKTDFAAAKAKGCRMFAYISVVELAKGSAEDAAAQKRAVPLVGSNADWCSHLLDIRTQAWRDFMIGDCAAPAAERGFDGFFLDTLDSAEHLGSKDAKALQVYHLAIIELVSDLKKCWPQKGLIVNRGFAVLPELKPHLEGVLVESVYQTFDPSTKRYRAQDAAGSAWLEARIKEIQAMNLKVYAVDYLRPADKALAKATVARLARLGCVPLVTTQRLRGDVIAP